ncbi:MAG TPA: hypothetical protein VFT42_10630, partial [Solirubrobacteraceae bacterium]|nr:hypothetical protein [Solirubrobacteraceae bacterium]
MIRSRLRRALRREPSLDELMAALSLRLPQRMEHPGAGPTVVGKGNRLDSLLLLGHARGTAEIEVGDECDLEGVWVLHRDGARLRVGSRTELNRGCTIECVESVCIGDDVLVAADVYISDNDSHSLDFEHRRHDHADRRRGERNWSIVPRAPVSIESKA